MAVHSEDAKHSVLQRVSCGQSPLPAGRAKYMISGHPVHVRFCSADRAGSPRYKFNINPNTLSAAYELWICGSPDQYYLLPIDIVSRIYNDPEGYPDRHHDRIRVVSVNVDTQTVTYAKGKKIDLAPYFGRTL